MTKSTVKKLSVNEKEAAKQKALDIIKQHDDADVKACMAEIEAVNNPILKKWNCRMEPAWQGQGNQCVSTIIIIKNK